MPGRPRRRAGRCPTIAPPVRSAPAATSSSSSAAAARHRCHPGVVRRHPIRLSRRRHPSRLLLTGSTDTIEFESCAIGTAHHVDEIMAFERALLRPEGGTMPGEGDADEYRINDIVQKRVRSIIPMMVNRARILTREETSCSTSASPTRSTT